MDRWMDMARNEKDCGAGHERHSRNRRSLARRRTRFLLSSQGFTLLELLVVLVILGLLAALAGPRVFNQLSGARADAARVQMEGLSTALEFYLLDNQAYPTSEQGLDALIAAPPSAERWNGPYLDSSEVPKDPWGNDYVYRSPGAEGGDFDLLSLGSDGRSGGEGSASDIERPGR
jgi:general secretion pathway protein G